MGAGAQGGWRGGGGCAERVGWGERGGVEDTGERGLVGECGGGDGEGSVRELTEKKNH